MLKGGKEGRREGGKEGWGGKETSRGEFFGNKNCRERQKITK